METVLSVLLFLAFIVIGNVLDKKKPPARPLPPVPDRWDDAGSSTAQVPTHWDDPATPTAREIDRQTATTQAQWGSQTTTTGGTNSTSGNATNQTRWEQVAQQGDIAPERVARQGDTVAERVARQGDTAAERVARQGELTAERLARQGEPSTERVARQGDITPERLARQASQPATKSEEPALSLRELIVYGEILAKPKSKFSLRRR